ncbi:MAG: putative ABC transporter permease [Eubacterium sp.]
MKSMINNDFIKCGIAGWCIELLFTSVCSFKKKNYKLEGHSSLWMFPVYGMASVIKPLSYRLKSKNRKTFERGTVYTVGIFGIEYVTGSILKRHNQCPWDYSKNKYNINGVIRLDYAPLWFILGLFFEKILTKD